MEGAARKRWTIEEFNRLIELGAVGADEQIYLWKGDLIVRNPTTPLHSVGKTLAAEALAIIFAGCSVRTEQPIQIPPDSQPEPDICSCRGRTRDYANHHPRAKEIQLVVEVSHSSLAFDKREKLPFYARSGIAEAWLVDIEARLLTVFRDPTPSGYTNSITVAEPEIIPYAEELGVRLQDLLP